MITEEEVNKLKEDLEFEIDSHNATARNMLTVIEQRNSLRFKLGKYRDYANSLLNHLANEPDTDEAKRAWDRLQALVDGDFPTEPEPTEPVEAKPDTVISVTTRRQE